MRYTDMFIKSNKNYHLNYPIFHHIHEDHYIKLFKHFF